MLLALSTFINQFSWGNAFNTLLFNQSQSEKKLINWIHDYFISYKEISKTWPNVIKNDAWFSHIYQHYADQKKKITFYIFKRNLLAQCLVEAPYLITSTAVFFGIYYNELSLSLAFAWLGMSQFMITASQGISKNSELKKTRYDNHKKIEALLHDIKQTSSPIKPSLTNPQKINVRENYNIKLQDGHKVTFSLCPGIYPITGTNGSGKSTLLDTIINFDRLSTLNQNASLLLLKNTINQNQIRIIDPNSTIIECLDDFTYQITGPLETNDAKKIAELLYKNLSCSLPPNLANQWVTCLFRLNAAFNARKPKELSSGEKILLSFARFWYSWQEDIKLLIIDECDSPLDQVNKKLFFDTLHFLKAKLAIFIVSHNIDPAFSRLNS